MGSSKRTNRAAKAHLKRVKRGINPRLEKDKHESRIELLKSDVDSEVKLNRSERKRGEAIRNRRIRKIEEVSSSVHNMFDDVMSKIWDVD